MAFTEGGTTTGAVLLRETFAPGFQEGVFKNNSLLSLFPAPEPSDGDSRFRWITHGGANSSVQAFNEGDPDPAPNQQDWYELAVPYGHWRGLFQISGHARAAMKSNWVNGIEEEGSMLTEDIIDLVTTTMMSGTNGLETMVDSTTTYAGQARGAAAWFESYETAHSAALTTTVLEDTREALRDNDVGARPSLVIGPVNQETNYSRLAGTPYMQVGDPNDKGQHLLSPKFAAMPFVGLPDFTNTVIMFLDMSPGYWAYVVHEPFNVKFQGRSGDSDVFAMYYRAILACKQPKKQGKITGVTA